MFHDRDQHQETDRRNRHGGGQKTATREPVPAGMPLDVFWALVDPVDRPDPRTA
ncbi:hypothetical protein [Sphingomonas solaris]|uniref:hypothetical protein n=1 Tax=Alterirhizorhabdus solaris TaxID=2529389 RepID=UPI001396778B|nr:hypothetical protein [Sphingomonas solaris]